MVLALSLWAPVLRMARAHWRNSWYMLPEPASLSRCTSTWERVSRLPLGLTWALMTFLLGIRVFLATMPRSREGPGAECGAPLSMARSGGSSRYLLTVRLQIVLRETLAVMLQRNSEINACLTRTFWGRFSSPEGWTAVRLPNPRVTCALPGSG
ncbi:hypothetical protein FQZ97_980620 [compost metagenome]